MYQKKRKNFQSFIFREKVSFDVLLIFSKNCEQIQTSKKYILLLHVLKILTYDNKTRLFKYVFIETLSNLSYGGRSAHVYIKTQLHHYKRFIRLILKIKGKYFIITSNNLMLSNMLS